MLLISSHSVSKSFFFFILLIASWFLVFPVASGSISAHEDYRTCALLVIAGGEECLLGFYSAIKHMNFLDVECQFLLDIFSKFLF